MVNNKERILIGSLALLGFASLGIVFFVLGEVLIDLLLVVVKYALYWICGGTIVLAIFFIAYMTFWRSETSKELFEVIIMGRDRK